MKAAYDACLDEDTIKSLGAAPLIAVLNETAHVNFTNDKDPLPDMILHLAKIGVNALISTGTGADDKDPDTVVVSVAAPYSIGLPAKQLYDDEKVVERYREVATKVLVSLRPDAKGFDAKDLVEFEKKLAAATPDAEDRDDVTVRRMT